MTHLEHAYFFSFLSCPSWDTFVLQKNRQTLKKQVVSILCYYCRCKEIFVGVYLTIDDRCYVRGNNYNFMYPQQIKIQADFRNFMGFLQHKCIPGRTWQKWKKICMCKVCHLCVISLNFNAFNAMVCIQFDITQPYPKPYNIDRHASIAIVHLRSRN